MILYAIGIAILAYVAVFFLVCAVAAFGRGWPVTRRNARRDGWDSFAVDMEASVALEDVIVTRDDKEPHER